MGNRVRLVSNSLLIVHVDVAVQPDVLEGFLAATEENAMASRHESGVVRFDVLSDRADPAHMVLVEVYRDEAAAAAHKETGHYQRWRDKPLATSIPRRRTRTGSRRASVSTHGSDRHTFRGGQSQ